MDNRIEIFTADNIDEIWVSNDPINLIFELIERNYRTKGIFEIEPSITNVITEFHLNNLIFFKEKFMFPNDLISKLLNLFSTLIELKDLEPNFNEIFRNKLIKIRNGIESLNLKIDEVTKLLKYIQTSYFPHIRLYYNFCNKVRQTYNKYIEIIINRPLIVPPLNISLEHKDPVVINNDNLNANNNEDHDQNKVKCLLILESR